MKIKMRSENQEKKHLRFLEKLEKKDESNMYKNILGSKKPVVILKDCLMLGKLLDKPLKYDNLLTCRNIKDSTETNSLNKNTKAIQDKCIAQYSNTASKIEENRNEYPISEKQNPVTVRDENNEDSYKILKNKALNNGKKLKVYVERVNLNIHIQTSNKLQGNEDSNKITDRGKDYLLLDARNNDDNNLRCNKILDIENNNENISPCVPISVLNETNMIGDKKYVEFKNLDEDKNLFGQRRTDINENIHNKTVKRIKLNEPSFQNNNDKYEEINTCNDERNITFESSSDKTLQLNSNESNLNFIRQQKSTSFSDCMQNQTSSEANDSFSLNSSSKVEEFNNESEDSDCISLFVDSTYMEEYDLSPMHNSLCIKNSHPVINVQKINMSKNDQKSTDTFEFNKVHVDNVNKTETNIFKKIQMNSVSNQPDSIAADNRKTSAKEKKRVDSECLKIFTKIFKGHCYLTISTGKCSKAKCHFNHNFIPTMINFYLTNEQRYFSILDKLALYKFTSFIYTYCYPPYLYICSNYNIRCTLKTIKKLYTLEIISDKVLIETIELFLKNQVTIKFVICQMRTIVNHSDFKFVNWFSKILKKFIVQGEYWITLKALLLKTEYLDAEIVEIILQECIITKKNIHEVNINIMHKLRNETHSKINQELLSSFEKLIEPTRKLLNYNVDFPTSSTYSIKTPTDSSIISKLKLKEDVDEHTKNLNIKNIVEKRNEKCDSNNEILKNENSDFAALDEIEFSEADSAVKCIEEGLERNDYNHVIRILNSVKKGQQSFFSRECYQILCKEIKYSQYHLSKLILQTVQFGATTVFYEILFDVTINILARLAEENLWVMAYTLLKDIFNTLYIKNNISDNYDAATIMLIAEIYIANYQYIKAFYLLKQTNIIYTDPKMWKVKHDVRDTSNRANIITLLLDIFCKISPEHAFFLFQFLSTDQCGNFYPVDLVHFANKMISMFLLKKDYTMVIEIFKLVDRYKFVLNAITYRALISTFVNIDIAFAKRLYQTAISLGIYFKVRFYPMTYIIINSDWTNEETYLALLNLMDELSLNIGHAVNSTTKKTFKIYLVFENISFKEHFAYNAKCKEYDLKFKQCTARVRKILRERFTPPISLSKKIISRIYPMNTISVLNHLKSRQHN